MPLGEDGPRFWNLKALCGPVGVFENKEETCDADSTSYTLIDLDLRTIIGEYHCVPGLANSRGIVRRVDDGYFLHAGSAIRHHFRADGSADSETAHYDPQNQIYLIDDSGNSVITKRKKHKIVTMGMFAHIVWRAMDMTHEQREEILVSIEQETEEMRDRFRNDIWGTQKTSVPAVPVKYIENME